MSETWINLFVVETLIAKTELIASFFISLSLDAPCGA